MRKPWTLIAAVVAVGLPHAAPAQSVDGGLPRAAIKDTFTKSECSLPIDDAVRDQQVFDLGSGKKLFLVNCFLAAYQSGGIAFVTEGTGAPRQLTFSDWDGKRFVPAKILTEIDFDPDKKTISSFYKGRGTGDCGSMATWSWTGGEFKLKDYFFKEKCDGRSFGGERRWRIFPRR